MKKLPLNPPHTPLYASASALSLCLLSSFNPTFAASTNTTATANISEAGNQAYARFPAIRNNTLVFTAEGDLWKVSASGGLAQRLTSHPSAETNAAISHDGKWLAFSASYEGMQEAYVMPVNGGLPKRLSFENGVVNVLGWSAQGEVLISAQSAVGPSASMVIASINPKSLQRTVFPLSDANEAVLDDAGKTIYFTRYGIHMRNDNTRQYRGGALAQIWRYDISGKAEAVRLFAQDNSSGNSNNRRPMWWNNQLYFISDQDGMFNLYSAAADGSARRQLSHHKEWEVRNPALGDGKIAYQLGADLHVLDLASASDKTLAIQLQSDFDQQRTHQIKSPLEQLSHVSLAGKSERIVVTARGRISVAGNSAQRRVEINLPNQARAREAVFSHDESAIYAIVDTSGENEIWKFPANGKGEGGALTSNGKMHRWNIYPSPDGKWLAHSDKHGRLYLLDLATKANTLIDDIAALGLEKHDEVTWSPDSKTIAITRPATEQRRNQIGLYNLSNKQTVFVTSDRYESGSPAFSPDGKWLYFISDRNFQAKNPAPWGDRNMGPFFDKRSGIYALALQAGLRFPFKADDELSLEKSQQELAAKNQEAKNNAAAESKSESKADNKADAQKSPASNKPLAEIQFAGLAQRLYEVPVAPGNYDHLSVDDKRLYFMDQEETPKKYTLKTLAIGKTAAPAEVFVSGIKNYELSADKKHIFYQTDNPKPVFQIVDAGAKQAADISKAKVQIDDWSVRSNPKLEWQQMFNDAWRMHRDFLFDDKMRGVNWNQVRTKYAPLVDRITDRAELNDLLGMMTGEVNTLHSQIRPGDIRKAAPESLAAGLGAVLTKTTEGYRIEHIYQSEAELPAQRGPLEQAELEIKNGDVILAVNGRSVLEVADISELLINQANKQVLLQIKKGGAATTTATTPAQSVIVTPVSMEKQASLRYGDWEQSRSARVQTASGGKIGYLHLRAMTPADLNTFAREFYTNIERDGLIIDVRRNNGGNIDSYIIEKLLRKAWAFWATPKGYEGSNMQQTFRGHLVVLIDELTYSDGETFAAGIKALNLGPLVGKRTAGAGVWLGDSNPLSDNGMARVAENGQFSYKDGAWIVEGVGVAPDVEVENLPHASFKGEDQQLETALKLLSKKMQEQALSKPVKGAISRVASGLK